MIVVVLGNGPPFPRVLALLGQVLREDPEERAWVQHGSTPLPAGMTGEAFVLHEQVIERMLRADVVVCHAGSGTILDALQAGHVPVVVPRLVKYKEHINDHQLDLAQALAADGRVVRVLEGEDMAAGMALAKARRVQLLETSAVSSAPAERSQALVQFLRQQLHLPGERRAPLRQRAVWGALRAVTPWVPRRKYDGT